MLSTETTEETHKTHASCLDTRLSEPVSKISSTTHSNSSADPPTNTTVSGYSKPEISTALGPLTLTASWSLSEPWGKNTFQSQSVRSNKTVGLFCNQICSLSSEKRLDRNQPDNFNDLVLELELDLPRFLADPWSDERLGTTIVVVAAGLHEGARRLCLV